MTETETVTHETTVEVVPGRYPYRPACSCGQAFRGYAARHAAEELAQAHAEGRA